MKRRMNESDLQPQVRAHSQQYRQDWLSSHSQMAGFLLALLFCYLFFLLFSIIPVVDYTAGIWPLFG